MKLENLEKVFVLNEKYILNPMEETVIPALKKYGPSIIEGMVMGATAYFGARLAVKHLKVNVYLVDGTTPISLPDLKK